MTVVHNAKTSGNLDHFSVYCDGVRLSSRTQAGVTVIAATGEIDASNIHHLVDYTHHHLTAAQPIVIDLTELDFLAAQGIPALLAIDERCRAAKVEWGLVPSHPVSRLLRICDTDGRLPAVSSIDDALERFTERNPSQRLLKLVTKPG